MKPLADRLTKIVKDEVTHHQESELFREPLVGFAHAEDPLYNKLDELIGISQMHPKEMLQGAKTVMVYFIPFSKKVVKSIRQDKKIVQEWSHCYTVTNKLLDHITVRILFECHQLGVEAVAEPPTENYDEVELTAVWAHKSSAVIAGLGTFGLNRLLITKAGTAGRLGSVVMNADIPPTERPTTSYCLFYQSETCRVCAQRCPSGALTSQGFDRFRCNGYLDGKNVHELQQGCGMCSSGPCALKGFEKKVSIK